MARSMASAGRTVNTAERTARGAATSPLATLLARLGYLAKGVVFLIIGILAARIAFGNGGTTSAGQANSVDRNTAIATIYQQPFGKFLLIVVAVGLIGYALFSLARGVLDIEHEGTKPGAILKRISYVIVAISYGLLAAAAINLVLGSGSAGQSSNASTQDWTRRLLDEPFGVPLVMAAGAVVIAFGLSQFVSAYKASFMKKMEQSRMGPRLRQWVLYCGRFGLAARGVVFTEIGIFLIVAAQRHDTHQAKGLGGALAQLANEPYGHWLLGLVAIGFIAYGIYAFAQARYRHIATA